MALETYRAKRRFDRTSEPSGARVRKAAKAAAGHAYLIQKHDARRLHYDLRLEMDGVLKSWAVTKGPSLIAGEKRLAVHVEDHPLEYGAFEGTIPKGEYGGGTVLLWDTGSWEPVGDPHKGYAKGHLEFELKGKKLHGRWHLIRMRGKPKETRENWLLIKADDEEARPASAEDILEEEPLSAKTGRDLDAIAQEAPGWSSKTGKIERAEDAAGAEPAAARSRGGSSRAKAADGKAAVAKAGKAKAGKAKAGRDRAAAGGPAQAKGGAARGKAAGAPAIKGAKAAPLPDFVPPSLAALVAAPPTGTRWIHEIKFDGYRIQARIDGGAVKLLTRSGLDWTDRFGTAITDALAALPMKRALIDGEVVVEGANGASDFSQLQADLSEGRADRMVFYAFDLLYRDSADLRDAPLTARKAALRALLEGAPKVLRYSEHFEEDGSTLLRHACRLSLEGVISKLREGTYLSGRGKHWVKSKCAERQEFVIGGYVPSTAAKNAIGSLVLGVNEKGGLRHVGRVGTGYTAKVARELFETLAAETRETSPFAGKLTGEEKRGVVFVAPKRVAEVEFRAWTGDGHLRHAAFRGLREDKPAAEIVREGGAQEAAAPRSRVKLTHPDRLYWPEDGVTKQGLADYYSEVWRRIAPFIVARPLALLRCPDGIVKACFFQKHAWRGINKAIRQVPDPANKGEEALLAIDDLDGLIALAQAGTLEIHPWGSSLAELERPDQIIFDLDPGPGIDFRGIVAAARDVRARLEADGLPAFVKTSGGKGLHVVAPLVPKAGWDAVKAYAKGVAEAMSRDEPDRFVAVATKAKRGGRIFVDYLRNGRGSTAVAPYSTRARPGAAVSMPVEWDELDQLAGAAAFTVANAPTRLAHLDRDPWAEFRKAAVPLKGKGGN